MTKRIIVKYSEEEMKELIKKYDGKIIKTIEGKNGEELKIYGDHIVLLKNGELLKRVIKNGRVYYNDVSCTNKNSKTGIRKSYQIPYVVGDGCLFRRVTMDKLYTKYYGPYDLTDPEIKKIIFVFDGVIDPNDETYGKYKYRRQKDYSVKNNDVKLANSGRIRIEKIEDKDHEFDGYDYDVNVCVNSIYIGKKGYCVDGKNEYEVVDVVRLDIHRTNKNTMLLYRCKIIYNDIETEYSWVTPDAIRNDKVFYLYEKNENGFYQTYIPHRNIEYYRRKVTQGSYPIIKRVRENLGFEHLLKISGKKYVTEEWLNIINIQDFLYKHAIYSDINLYPRVYSNSEYLMSPENCYCCQLEVQTIIDYILGNKVYITTSKEFRLGKNLHERLQKIYEGEHGQDAFVLINLEFINLLYKYMDDLDLSSYSIQQIKDEIIEYSEKVYGKKYYTKSRKPAINYFAENFNVFVDNARLAFKDEIEKVIKKLIVKRKGLMIDEK